MGDRPTIHLTNGSSRKLHGPGRKWTIMTKPRRWEHGDGCVLALRPSSTRLGMVHRGEMDLATYRAAFEEDMGMYLEHRSLEHGRLTALSIGRCPVVFTVSDGDTLCCACSRADASAGKCHRAWAAPFLVRAGWRVVLDGVEVTCAP